MLNGLYTFGFKSAKKSTYKYSKVKQQLGLSKPVLISSFSKKTQTCILPFWCINRRYEGGHVWICDGYVSTYYCETGTSYLRFHMNWGVDGNYNGYYSFNGDWKISSANYKYKREMIYDL